ERPLLPRLSDLGVVLPSIFMRGREEDLLSVIREAAISTLWLRAAEAFLARDFTGAAALYAEIGTAPDEAYARLQAAAHLAAHGQRREADEQLEAALIFYRSVGASRYIRGAQTVPAASA